MEDHLSSLLLLLLLLIVVIHLIKRLTTIKSSSLHLNTLQQRDLDKICLC